MFKGIRNMFGCHDWPKGELVLEGVGREAQKLAAGGNLRAAVAVYERFLGQCPNSAQALNNASSFLLQLGEGHKAKDYLERALKIDPGYESAICNLAEAKLMLKDVVGARDAFEQALAIKPGSVAARMGLGRMFLEMKNGKVACRHLEEAVRLQPQNPVAWHNLGAAKMMVGDLDGAEEALKRAVALDPNAQQIRMAPARLQSMRQMAAAARRSGTTVTMGNGTVISGTNRTLTCQVCGKMYTEHGQIQPLLGRRSLGGALCRNCGRFYCQHCADRAIAGGRSMQCACGKAQATMGDRYVKLEGFEELVVFPAS